MSDHLLNRPEIEGVAIACGLCCVDGFGKTVCTAFSGMEHVLKFAHEIERAARKAAIEECAKACDEMADGYEAMAEGDTRVQARGMADAAITCADAIRALREES